MQQAATLHRDPPATPRHPRILLIEDDRELAEEIREDLLARGYIVSHAADGLDGLTAARNGKYDLLVVDRLLPGLDGLTIVESLRAERVDTPVLVVSALGAVDDRVRGLKAGGDDYLAKPFAFAEFAARIEALLRRPLLTRETIVRVGSLTLDLIERTAQRDQRAIELLPTEFKLLEYLMHRAGQVVTRGMLLEDVWHYRFLPHTNVVDVHIGKLRRKIDGPGEPPMIHSVRGAGFTLRSPD